MVIIDSLEAYENFERQLNGDCIVIPIQLNDYVHSKLNSLTCAYVRILNNNQEFILTFLHSETLFDSSEKFKDTIEKHSGLKYVLDKNEFLYHYPNASDVIDLELVQYLDNGNKISLPKFEILEFFKHRYPRYKKVNALVPILKYVEYFNKIYPIINNLIDTYKSSSSQNAFIYYNNIIIPNLHLIESNALSLTIEGLAKSVDTSISVDTDKNLIYSQYNIFTTTGRPSNRFNSINFAALEKKSGIRDIFNSRFDNGILVEFDFESYHLRIVSELVGYTLPTDMSVHEYFGRQYFKTNEKLTPEQYDQSKKISFKHLYGNISPEYKNVEFFVKVKQYINSLWKKWDRSGYIESPVSGRRLYKKNYPFLNPAKLFNYLIQCLETELNLKKIDEVNKFLSGYNTKLILYTYDALLFDMDLDDGKECILGIKNILEQNEYVTRSYIGVNYGHMERKRIREVKESV